MSLSPLCTVAWVLQHRSDPAIRFLDCRHQLGSPSAGLNAYRAGHIPGAVHADLEQHLSGPKQPSGAGGRHPLPEPEIFAAWLGTVGIGNQHHLICYDDPSGGQGFYASRAWWLLRWLGHEQVQVLDGGWPAYLAAGGPVSIDQAVHAPAQFIPQVQPALVADAGAVLRRSPRTLLIDSRAPSRYRGDEEPLDRQAGHIPGAVNRPWMEALDQQGHWHDAKAQAERLGQLERPSIAYCGSGISATPNILARVLAGVPLGEHNQLYAGSWSDWISDDQREIAVGEA